MKLFSRIAAKTLIITLIIPFLVNPTFAIDYSDAFDYLKSNNLLPSEMETQFGGNEIITSHEFYAMILSYAGEDIASQTEVDLPYTDVEKTEWYAKYIQTALDTELIRASAYKPIFTPNRKLRKREIITKLFDTLGVGVNKFFDKNDYPFTDMSKKGNFAPYAYQAYKMGIYEESRPNMVSAAKMVTKGEVANYLLAIDQYKKSEGGEVTVTINNSSNSSSSGNTYTKAEKTLVEDPGFEVMLDIWSTIQESYYYQDEIDNTEMIYEAVNGLVEYLDDPYTTFSTPAELSTAATLQSEYEGLGMSVEIVDNELIIISPFRGSPAEEAGLKPNDVITEIDGTSTEGLTINEAVNKIKGPSGSKVSLTIKRDGTTLTFSVTRGHIFYKTAYVTFEESSQGTAAIINVVTFSEGTFKEFKAAAEEIIARQEEKGDIDGIVVDLRSNPGGYLNVAIDMLGLFFEDDKTVVVLEDSDGSRISYYSKEPGILADYQNIAVLVNDGSASASEIFAGALQDWNKAEIIGTQSYGKGTVQELSFYNDGSTFKLTVSKWLTPKNHDINKKGVTPDQKVKDYGDTDPQLTRAIQEVLN